MENTTQSLQQIGRYSDIHNVPEVQDLQKGMDFRLPQYRREVFLRFYEFHVTHRSHPGGVYFAFPWLTKYFNMTQEDKYWLAFINGCTQHIVTSSIIFEKFPSIKDVDIDELDTWWNENQHRFKAGSGWDADRRYFKVGRIGLPNCVKSYKENVLKFGSQEAMFNSLTESDDIFENFRNTWKYVSKNFLSFGRLSTFSYLEYLKIQGLNIDCDSLFIDDILGSKSHRNGLCKVLGRDDLDWNDRKGSDAELFPGYEKETLDWITQEGNQLLSDAKSRIKHNTHEVSHFTLESTLCCYKSWYRESRRYPNVYMDMMHHRIVNAETTLGPLGYDFSHFWRMRDESLPDYLRIETDPLWFPESNPNALSKEKQNWFREHGEVILLGNEWPCFESGYQATDQSLKSFFG